MFSYLWNFWKSGVGNYGIINKSWSFPLLQESGFSVGRKPVRWRSDVTLPPPRIIQDRVRVRCWPAKENVLYHNTLCCKKNHSVCVSSGFVFCILMVFFSVYYLGVYMIFGVIVFLLFSVSTTLKVCIYIIAHKKIKSRGCFASFPWNDTKA